MGNKFNLKATLKTRYKDSDMATDKQIGLIKKIFYDLGKYEQSKRCYKNLTYFQAWSLIETLKGMANKKKNAIRAKRRQDRKSKSYKDYTI